MGSLVFPLTRKLILNDSPCDLTQHCEREQPSLHQSTTELSTSSIMHSTSATASSLILCFQTCLSALSEPPLRACQSNSLAFVRPAASTEAWLRCSRFKPVTENDWLVWRGRGSHLHFDIFGITDWSSAKPVCNTRKGREYLRAKRKGVGKKPQSCLFPALTCHISGFILGLWIKARWYQSIKKNLTKLSKPKNNQEVCPRGRLHGNWGAPYIIRLEHKSRDLRTHTWDFRHATSATNRLINRNNESNTEDKRAPQSLT